MRLPITAAALIAFALPGAAQTPAEPSSGTPSDRVRAGYWQPHVGLHAGTPQRVSAALGVMRVLWRTGDFTAAGGPRLVLEPGLRAGKVRLGYARTGAFATGYAVEAAVLRHWGVGQRADATILGLEAHGSLMFIDVGLGVYPGRSGEQGILAASVGLVL